MNGAALLLLLPASMLADGLLLAQFWAWHVQTAFRVPGLTVGQCIGLSMVIALITPSRSSKSKSDEFDFGQSMFLGGLLILARFVLLLFVGWLVWAARGAPTPL